MSKYYDDLAEENKKMKNKNITFEEICEYAKGQKKHVKEIVQEGFSGVMKALQDSCEDLHETEKEEDLRETEKELEEFEKRAILASMNAKYRVEDLGKALDAMAEQANKFHAQEEKKVEILNTNILGTRYSIHKGASEKDFPELEEWDGFVDWTSNDIYIREPRENAFANFERYERSCIRHEIVHAFLHESGLDSDSGNIDGPWAANEEMVDWIAIQFPKIYKVFEQLGVLD